MQGPALHAIITGNPKAMETAADMDRSYRADSATVGLLHCIPTILKDNFNTFDMPTTGGNIGMKTSVPPADAFTVAKIRKAGALILAKANLQEFARGGMSISSLGGQVRNPYDLSSTPGGSSGGTGAAIAANFAVLGTGSDTGQSVRSPASASYSPKGVLQSPIFYLLLMATKSYARCHTSIRSPPSTMSHRFSCSHGGAAAVTPSPTSRTD